MSTQSLAERIAELNAKAEQGNWQPAAGGTETVFTTRSGIRLLYCYQPSTGKHAYLNVDSDMFLSNEEASNILNW